MASKSEVVNYYLGIHRSGSYATMANDKLSACWSELSGFLNIHLTSLKDQELYNLVELHFFLCLLTNHDIEAKTMLDFLADKFDHSLSQRLGLLTSFFIQAVAPSGAINGTGSHDALKYLEARDPNEIDLMKRKIGITKSVGHVAITISELIDYLNLRPTDAEAWCELAEQYALNASFSEAIYSLQRALVSVPAAYNLYARLGELFHEKSLVLPTGKRENLREGCRHSLRAVELAADYARGWAGVYVCSKELLGLQKAEALEPQDVDKYTKLRDLAKRELERIESQKLASEEDLNAVKLVLEA